MRTIDRRRAAIASLLALPMGVSWFAELVFRDVDATGVTVNILTGLATGLIVAGPVVAGWFWRGSGLIGAVIGTAVGTLAAWPAYRAIATSLSSTPISEYELGWTSFAAGAWVVLGLVAGVVAWAFGAARHRVRAAGGPE